MTELTAEAQGLGVTLRDGSIRVILEANDGQATEATKTSGSLGATVETSYGDLIQALVPVAALERLSNDASVRYVRQPFRAEPRVTSEGLPIINADDWQAAGVTGSGVKVAVLDLGFDGYTSLLGTELPASVTAQSFRADGGITGGGIVHGTAVAEIVHDVAPSAQMYLVNWGTEVEFLNAVDWLIAQDVDVINHSAGWEIIGPGNGTGYINDKVTQAVSSGILWSNAMANEAQSHWTGLWSDPDADALLNFSGTDEGNSVALYASEAMWIEMKWTDLWPAGCMDYDLYITNSAGVIVQYSENVQNCSSSAPVEYLGFVAPYDDTFRVWIHKYSATGTPRFHLFWDLYLLYPPPVNLQYVVASRSLGIPEDNPNVLSVGAVNWQTPSTIEPFSSQGPTEDNRTKPDLVAPDGVSTATYGPSDFFGCSASSPHVAGAAALVKQAFPAYTPAQVKSFLEGRAVPLGAAGKDNIYGSGRLDLGSIDADGDHVADPWDNCPPTSNPNQLDRDGDGSGDVCDGDDDGDGRSDGSDNCPSVPNANQLNSDGDAQGDACDPDDDGDGRWDAPDVDGQTADLDGDGDTEEASPTRQYPSGEAWVRDTDGDGDWDVWLAGVNGLGGAARVIDLDNDGEIEVVVRDTDLAVGTYYAWTDGDGDADLAVVGGTAGLLAPGLDVDGDGEKEAVIWETSLGAGNTVDEDVDGDGDVDVRWIAETVAGVDNCPTQYNVSQDDEDSDGLGDECDNCPDDPNSGQEDGDGDDAGDVCDNCLETHNPGQEDNDGDGVPATEPPSGATWGGDACDADDDNDLMPDTYEEAHSCLDPFVADAKQNADGDELRNYAEMVVATNPCVANPELAVDSDLDEWSNGKERFIGTDLLDACPDGPSDDAWPPDFKGLGGCGFRDGKVNILDVLCYKWRIAPNPYERRYDLNADGAVNILDVLLFKWEIGKDCTNP